MLTPDEFAAFRARVSSRRPDGPVVWVWLEGGPLDDLQIPLVKLPTRGQCGWCHVTAKGPVVANYRQGDDPDVMGFVGWDTPGWKASGMRATGAMPGKTTS